MSSLILCSTVHDISYKNKYYKLKLDSRTGSIKVLAKNGTNLIYQADSKKQPLFNICFRDRSEKGQVHRINAHHADNFQYKVEKEKIKLFYSQFKDIDLQVNVKINISPGSPKIRWNISIENHTPYVIDHIDFPNIVVKNDLTGTGGTGRLFWPAQGGCLIEDTRIRQDSKWVNYNPDFPQIGWGGYYPASAQMQYMAYYNKDGGLYFAAHDEKFHPKGIEFHKTSKEGIELNFRLFTKSAKNDTYQLPYDMVLNVFEGNWYDASSIYRDWRDSSDIVLPPKIKENKSLPEWYFDSPIVVTYPIRGHTDLDKMSPNDDFFPYTNALKYINKYKNEFNSKIMALLMHWEGTAPWAPPYVWPPYGGEKKFKEFVKEMHQNNNLVGLYASGIGYTLESNLDTTYKMYKEYNNKNLQKVMRVAPDGELAPNGVCAGPYAQRIGHDMCPANDFVKKVVLDQISKIIASNTDYIQYFDQNLGGACYPCYGTSHGHSYGPGIWQNKAMNEIYNGIQTLFEKHSKKPLVGCEAAAAEPFMHSLLFNDSRFHINLFVGKPVPAYAYVNHQYVNNFMGNQNGIAAAINIKKSPHNFLQRLAYSFCAGDMLTVVLRGNGDMIWGWGTPWEHKTPDQKNSIRLIKNLNSWRQKGAGKKFLTFGKMLKPIPVTGTENIPMITGVKGREIDFSSIFTSNWKLEDNRKAQFFVNYLPKKQTIQIPIDNLKNVKIYRDPQANPELINKNNKLNLSIKPLSAVMMRYEKN
jgi:hypothetical protein